MSVVAYAGCGIVFERDRSGHRRRYCRQCHGIEPAVADRKTSSPSLLAARVSALADAFRCGTSLPREKS